MELEAIHLEHIGCFTEKHIDFSNLTVVYGENRAGKSTLIYAIFFALFGRHLNTRLSVRDLRRKGKPNGAATLFFRQEETRYRLRQPTDGLPKLAAGQPDEGWQPVPVSIPGDLRRFIPTPPETAALSTFFREGELIYFLQDVPRYNQTLLQNMAGLDDLLVLRSRFKKAKSRAREYLRGVQASAPKQTTDPLNVELTRRQLQAAEQDMQSIEAEYQSLLRAGGPDLTVYQLLQKQHDERQKRLESLRTRAADIPSPESLEQERKSLEQQIRAGKDIGKRSEDLRQEYGRWTQTAQALRQRLERLSRLEASRNCPLCEQPVPPERVSGLIAELTAELQTAVKTSEQLKAQIHTAGQQEKAAEEHRLALEQVRQQQRTLHDLRQRTVAVERQIDELAKELQPYTARQDGVQEARTRYQQKETLENRRTRVQDQMVQYKIQLKQYEDLNRRVEESRNHLRDAEQKVRLCDIACQAVEDAVQALGSGLLDDVREHLGKWYRHFTFLHHFDIQMSDRELLPMIQARGYQYKLNQMSKSERIFLYLLMKLAIGDALGHLGLFILDDPADGLDHKRKKILAYLLAEVARERQVIVTTNDPDFVGQFTGVKRVDL